MAEIPRKFTHDDYTIGLICALAKTELVATRAMLDDEHPPLAADPADTNAYFLGRMGHHNVVIACLPAEITGSVSAATVAKDLLRSFRAVRFGLMIGIGGGVPLEDNIENNSGNDLDSEDEISQGHNDVRLGDVVISLHSKSSEAVIQYDFGKSLQGGEFIRTGTLDKPPKILLSSLTQLQAEHELKGHKLEDHLLKMIADYPRLAPRFRCPGSDKDRAFKSTAVHREGAKSCKACCGDGPLDANLIRRKARKDSSPMLHYGTIGSGDQVVKDSVLRDRWAKSDGIICFEMEAAGLMDSFPCLVIRGICDYADSHKSKVWQPYAAATAAAFAKEFLHFVSAQQVLQEKPILQVLGPALAALQDGVSEMSATVKEQTKRQEARHMNDQQRACCQVFKTCSYEQFKNNNPDRVPGTCVWVLQNPKYIEWLQSQRDNLLWISADPGCGKSVLSRSLVENELRNTDSRCVCYFFFKDNESQEGLATALCSLLHQLFVAQPQLTKHALTAWEKSGDKLRHEVNELWRIFLGAATDEDSHDVICVLDALDECRERDRRTLLGFLSRFYSEPLSRSTRRNSLKFLATSRPYDDIEAGFQDIPSNLPTIRLSGERENNKIREEIDLVIRKRVEVLATNNRLSSTATEVLLQWLLRMEHRTYLWLYLALNAIEDKYKYSLRPNSESIESLQPPSSIDDAYEKILCKITNDKKTLAITILHIIVGSRRPLSISEMAIALGLATQPNAKAYAAFKIDDKRIEELLRQLCGLFVFFNHSKIYLIHQTAKEFLVQKEVSAGTNCWKHCLRPSDSETIMATICVDYLSLDELDLSKLEGLAKKRKDVYYDSGIENHQRQSATRSKCQDIMCGLEALLEYSAEHWPAHLRSSTINNKSPVMDNVIRLYSFGDQKGFQLWSPFLWRVQRPWGGTMPNMSNIILAAFNGHDIVVYYLLINQSFDIDAIDSDGRTALSWAAELGHEKAVDLLLEKGANVNAQGRHYGNALYTASAKGHGKIVQMLLEKGAEVNAQGGDYGNALQAASIIGHDKIVQMLLEKGADVNAQSGHYGNALQAASARGHNKIIQMLLEKYADVNAQSEHYGNALYIASARGHDKIVQMLLEKGADINAQSGHYGNALQAASTRGNDKIVQMLLEKGALQAAYRSDATG